MRQFRVSRLHRHLMEENHLFLRSFMSAVATFLVFHITGTKKKEKKSIATVSMCTSSLHSGFQFFSFYFCRFMSFLLSLFLLCRFHDLSNRKTKRGRKARKKQAKASYILLFLPLLLLWKQRVKNVIVKTFD